MADLENLSVEELRSMRNVLKGSPAITPAIQPEQLSVSSPSGLNWRGAAETVTGGLLNIGSGLTLGAMPKIVAGGTALTDALFGGQPIGESYANRLAQVRALEQGYKESPGTLSVAGVPVTEIGGSFLMPLPGLKAKATTKVAPSLEEVAVRLGENNQTIILPTVKKVVASPVVEAAKSIAKQAGLGAGLSGTQTLISSDKPIEQRLQDAASSAGVGALFGGVLGSGVEAVKTVPSLARALSKYGEGLQRSSLGLRKSDLTAKRNIILKDGSEASPTQLTQSLNNLIKNNTLGQSRNPVVLYNNAIAAKDALESNIQSTLQAVDESGVKIAMPTFPNATKYLEDNRVDITDIGSYENIIKNFKAAVKNESKFVEPDLPTFYDEFDNVIPKTELPGMKTALEKWQRKNATRSKLSLDVLNKQKKVFGESYKDGPQSEPGFWRAFYKDLKEHIEQYAPEVKQLNKQKQDLIVAEPILERGKKAAEQPMTGKDVARSLFYTTGRLGLPGAIAVTGLPVIGTALALGLNALGTKTGQNITGKLATKIGQAGQNVTGAGAQSLANALQRITPSLTAQEPSQQTFPTSIQVEKPTSKYDSMSVKELQGERSRLRGILNDLKSPTEVPQKQNISALIAEQPAEIRAIIDTESSGNPTAKSSKGATGLMQLMPGTAKELGVDPLDPVQNIEGGTRYYNQMKKQFPDRKVAFAAYNWGPGNMANAVAKVEKKGQKPTWQNILKYNSVPTETEEYVKRVIKKLNQLEA